MVYGALTVIVTGLYVLVVGTLGTLFQTSGNIIISLLATGFIAMLFQPLRQRLQRGGAVALPGRLNIVKVLGIVDDPGVLVPPSSSRRRGKTTGGCEKS